MIGLLFHEQAMLVFLEHFHWELRIDVSTGLIRDCLIKTYKFVLEEAKKGQSEGEL